MGFEINDFHFYLAHVVIFAFTLFYLTLDVIFAVVFAVGGYAAQFIGHAVERSMPVLVKHPVQANLAAPFFTVVELFKLAGLRNGLFDAVQEQIESQRRADQTT